MNILDNINMNIGIGYILGHLSEFILFIYYANTSFYPRKNYVKSTLISFAGYFILYLIGFMGNVLIAIPMFFIINVFLLRYCYNVNLKKAMFYSLVLDSLSATGEYIIIYIMGFRYNGSIILEKFTQYQAMLLTIGGKLIYLTGVVFLRHFTNKKTVYDNDTQLILAAVPILTIICLNMMMGAEIEYILFLIICVLFLLINIAAFYVNEMLNDKNRKLRLLQAEYNQNKAELSEYELLSEKYENTKIMRHDLHKQLSVLNGLIGDDNEKAKEYMRQMRIAQSELDYAQYTDNKILNVLFAQKVKEAHACGVEIHISSSAPELSFISDIDAVAIFSNLLDNAIDACEESEKKEIYVDLYTVNDVYLAIKIENSADKEPVVLNGILRSQKKNADIHGIGIKSINNALKKYNSELSWSYDKENRIFCSMALIRIPPKR